MDKRRAELLQGNLWKLMIRLAIPGILGMAVVALNGLIDAFYVSHFLGEQAFAGISQVLPLVTFLGALTTWIASGGSVVYSRAIGREDRYYLDHLFGQLLILLLLAWMLILVLNALLGDAAFGLLSSGDAYALAQGKSYFNLLCWGYGTTLLALSTSALIRAEGNIRQAMTFTAFSLALNMGLHPFFMGVLNMGIQGAAIATTISMGIYSLLNLRYFYQKQGYLRLQIHRQVQLAFLKLILKSGLPSGIMQINGFFRQLLLFKLLALYSPDLNAYAAFSAIYRLFSFLAIPMFGFLQALAPTIGMNYGADQFDRVKEALRTFRFGSIAFLLLLVLPFWYEPKWLLSLLLPSSAISVEVQRYFRWMLLILPLMPLSSTGIVFLQNTQHSKTASIITFSRELLLFAPLMIALVYHWQYPGLYLGLFIENLLYITIVLLVCRRVSLPNQNLLAL